MMVNYKMMNDDIEFRKKDSYEKNQLIEKMKEKMVEYQKYEQKFKILESKYIYDVSNLKSQLERHSKSVQSDLSQKAQLEKLKLQ